jgi:hypothetical protein
MVIIINWAEFIKQIPDVLQYVVPGYMALSLFSWLTDIKVQATPKWIWSGLWSFVTVSIIKTWFGEIELWPLVTCCVIIDVLIAAICGSFVASGWWRDYIAEHFGLTASDSLISQYIDWENGTNVSVYLKSERACFYGPIKTVGEPDFSGAICIENPTKYDLDGNELYSHDDGVIIAIPMSDVMYIKIAPSKR